MLAVYRTPVHKSHTFALPKSSAQSLSYSSSARPTDAKNKSQIVRKRSGATRRSGMTGLVEPFLQTQLFKFRNVSLTANAFLALRSFATDTKVKEAPKEKVKKDAPKEKKKDPSKDKEKKEKEKEKLMKQKEMEKQKKEKEKQKEAERKEREKKKVAEQKEKEKLRKQKEKEKQLADKEKEKEKAKKAKEKESMQKEKAKEVQVKEKEKEKKAKKKKDEEGKPGRPMSAYSYFFRARLGELRKANPDADLPGMAKQVGADWNALSESGRQPYIKQATATRKDYDEKLAAYQKTLPPKRPASSFMLFSEELRPTIMKQNPKMTAPDVARTLGAQWKQLTPQKKKRYEEKAITLKEAWQKEMDKRAKKSEKGEKASA